MVEPVNVADKANAASINNKIILDITYLLFVKDTNTATIQSIVIIKLKVKENSP